MVEYKTKCLSCGTKYIKEIFLFDYCPICKGKKLKVIKKPMRYLSAYKITGFYANTNKRFKTLHFQNESQALSINLWRGRVYKLNSNDKYQIIKEVF